MTDFGALDTVFVFALLTTWCQVEKCGRVWRAQPSQAHATTTLGSALSSRDGQVNGNIMTTCVLHAAFPSIVFVLVLHLSSASGKGGLPLELPSHEYLAGAGAVC